MLAIGRALMARPKLILMDEPSMGLSPLLVKEVFSIIRRINARTGRDHPAGGAERPDGAWASPATAM
jgi:ABC-type histidine transport system ATPase subunit